jgi:hypothetical protein
MLAFFEESTESIKSLFDKPSTKPEPLIRIKSAQSKVDAIDFRDSDSEHSLEEEKKPIQRHDEAFSNSFSKTNNSSSSTHYNPFHNIDKSSSFSTRNASALVGSQAQLQLPRRESLENAIRFQDVLIDERDREIRQIARDFAEIHQLQCNVWH